MYDNFGWVPLAHRARSLGFQSHIENAKCVLKATGTGKTVGEAMDDLRRNDPDEYALLTEHVLWGEDDNE